ncbi:MAG: GNAT family N-acetyltransferase [Planctomycetota bacterium]
MYAPTAVTFTTSLDGITSGHLHGFFEGWPTPPSPAQHFEILRAARHVVLAVDPATSRVVGFVTAIGDGVFSAAIPLLEVLPDYRKQGLGSELVRRTPRPLATFKPGMRSFANLLLIATVLGCAWMFWLAVLPGRGEQFADSFYLQSQLYRVGVLVVAWPGPVVAVLLILVMRRAVMRRGGLRSTIRRAMRAPWPWRRAALAGVLLILTFVLCWGRMPLHAGFALSRDSFEPLTQNLTATTPQVSAVNVRVGLYRVQALGVDPRGGVYFVVHTTTPGIGPDPAYHGFAFEPNRLGSPFGENGYRLRSLGDGWYAFRAH